MCLLLPGMGEVQNTQGYAKYSWKIQGFKLGSEAQLSQLRTFHHDNLHILWCHKVWIF
jgi:hypothetical protein